MWLAQILNVVSDTAAENLQVAATAAYSLCAMLAVLEAASMWLTDAEAV
jgi:hypothetical protein